MTYTYDPNTGTARGHFNELKGRLAELKVAMQAGKATASDMLAKGRAVDSEWDYVEGGLGAATEALAITDAIKSIREDEALVERLGSHGFDPDWRGLEDDPTDFNRAAVKAGLVRAAHSKGTFGFNMPFRKAALTSPGVPASGQGVTEPTPGASAVALRELLTPHPDAPPVVRYYRVGRGGGADVVPEGGLKPELTTDIEPVDAALQKIAVRFTYTDEMVEDAEFLVSYIQREAMRAVLLRENALVVAALDDATGALTAEGTLPEAIDVIAGAIGAAEASNGLTPTAIVAHPVDVATIRTSKASGSGEYTLDPLAGGPPAIHDVPLSVTSAVAPGTMYLTTPGVGTFYTRGGLRVEAGYTGDDWTHNRVTTRVEERVLPVVAQPSLLTRITLTPA